jgi:polyisoprenoid-binding protein YceI
MKTHLFSLVFALGLVGSASAQAPAPHDPSAVEAGTYAVDPNHTQVQFTVSHMGFSNYTGIFSGASGELTLDPKAAGKSTLKVSVPVKSVMTTSTKLDEELKSAQWIDATQFPDMTFVSTKVTLDGKDKAKVAGDLTLHGVTKPIVLAVTFVGAGTNPLSKKYNVGFEAKGEIKRSDFGVKTYVPLIGDALHLTIAGAFEKK